jgi:hypothetical protein
LHDGLAELFRFVAEDLSLPANELALNLRELVRILLGHA